MVTPEMGHVVGEFQKNRSERVKGILKTWQGVDLLDLRVFHTDQNGIERPTQKGLCLKIEALAELKKIVTALEEAISTRTKLR